MPLTFEQYMEEKQKRWPRKRNGLRHFDECMDQMIAQYPDSECSCGLDDFILHFYNSQPTTNERREAEGAADRR